MIILQDLKRKQQIFAEDGAPSSLLKIFLTDGSSAMVLYRLMHFLSRNKLKPVAYLVQWFNKFVNGCIIGTDASFQTGFVIMHPIGIVINSKVKGGKNVTLEGGVVIGDEKGQSPLLGEFVFVGSSAKIMGAVNIGNNVKIGANAVVIKDVPANHTAVGVPAKCLPNKRHNSK